MTQLLKYQYKNYPEYPNLGDYDGAKTLLRQDYSTDIPQLSQNLADSPRYRYEVYDNNNLERPKRESIEIDKLDKLSSFEKILEYVINLIELKDNYLFNRIRELKELSDADEDCIISLESLKSMFLFVGKIGNFSRPHSITVSENGLFYMEWERDNNNSITLRFVRDYFLDYVIFKASSHIKNKRIIFNGSMSVMDMIDYLNDLNIKIHRQV